MGLMRLMWKVVIDGTNPGSIKSIRVMGNSNGDTNLRTYGNDQEYSTANTRHTSPPLKTRHYQQILS